MIIGIIRHLSERSESGREALQQQASRKKREVSEAQSALDRLYSAIEAGLVDVNDPDFKQRIDRKKLHRDEAAEHYSALEARLTMVNFTVTTDIAKKFTNAVKERLHKGTPEFRRSYLRLFVERVEMDDHEIRIFGSNDVLLQAIKSGGDFFGATVPSFVREWRPLRDSNPCCRRERAVS